MNPILRLDQISLEYPRYTSPSDIIFEWITRKPKHATTHALTDINFALNKGTTLGIIGNNGAGKSSLLKLLSGNLKATSGTLERKGSVSAILELGGGFHPDFTGHDNARLGLSFIGIPPQSINHCLESVQHFSELGEAFEHPTKTYSSGMLVRLAFSIAVSIEPDILIVDEALSVGDHSFQKKSLDRIKTLLAQNTSLVFCSHNLYQVKEICEQAIWLEEGKIKQYGAVDAVTDAYQDSLRQREKNDTTQHTSIKVPTQTTHVATQPYIEHIQLNQTGKIKNNHHDEAIPIFNTGDTFSITTLIHLQDTDINKVHLGLVIRRNDDVQCYGISTLHEKKTLQALDKQRAAIRFTINQLTLLSGEYCLEAWLIDNSGLHIYDSRERCCHFKVRQSSQKEGIGISILEHHWDEIDEAALSST